MFGAIVGTGCVCSVCFSKDECNAGVDVSSLLSKVGINVNATSEKVGTVAIAYAAHKALSPVRFPPTVALTPVVARFLGKGQDPSDSVSDGSGPAP